MELIKCDIEEFKCIIYPEYVKIFPEIERKSYQTLMNLINKNISKIFKITDNNVFVGFIIANSIKSNKYIQIDYFAILPQYQNLGHGTKALKQFIKDNQNYNGIFLEVESVKCSKNEVDFSIIKNRIRFYENIGFKRLNYTLLWFNSLMLNPYVFNISNDLDTEETILQCMLEIYNSVHGEKKVEESLKILQN